MEYFYSEYILTWFLQFGMMRGYLTLTFYFEMDEEEAKAHMMRLVYHMLGVVNEIRIISNARIRKDCESEELCIERQKEAEKFLSENVAA